MPIHLPPVRSLLAVCVAGNTVVMERALKTYQKPGDPMGGATCPYVLPGIETALLNCIGFWIIWSVVVVELWVRGGGVFILK